MQTCFPEARLNTQDRLRKTQYLANVCYPEGFQAIEGSCGKLEACNAESGQNICIVNKLRDRSKTELNEYSSRMSCDIESVGQTHILRLSASGRTFDQQWLAHTGCQVHHLQRDWIDDVACRTQLCGEFAC